MPAHQPASIMNIGRIMSPEKMLNFMTLIIGRIISPTITLIIGWIMSPAKKVS